VNQVGIEPTSAGYEHESRGTEGGTSELRPSGRSEGVATLVTAKPIVCVARVSAHHRERFGVRTGAPRAWRGRDVNLPRCQRMLGVNGTLHEDLRGSYGAVTLATSERRRRFER
jgi:hypothetical protein